MKYNQITNATKLHADPVKRKRHDSRTTVIEYRYV